MAHKTHIAPVTANGHNEKLRQVCDKVQKEELRRLMYERIAQGHQLAEIETIARYKQHGR
jgi:hypothetical protein